MRATSPILHVNRHSLRRSYRLTPEGLFEEYNDDKFKFFANHPRYAQELQLKETQEAIEKLVGKDESEMNRSRASSAKTIYCDPPQIHTIRLGDTLKEISKHYGTTVELLRTCNGDIQEVSDAIEAKRKFVVIPSPDTFTGQFVDVDFCLEVAPYSISD